MDGLQIIGSMLAGLGLFFVGIQMLSSNLRQLTSRRFRLLLANWTKSPFVSAFIGALLGATMQTGSAITFILVGMIGAGMISVERSLPVRLGAAMGTSTMVFVATLNIQLFILFIIGIAGVALTQSKKPRPLVGALFGAGLMFFGLKMVGTGAAPLTELPWFRAAIAQVNGAPVAALILGTGLSILVQSPQSVTILAITMTDAGILGVGSTIAIIYGGNLGGGISTYMLSSGFRGTSRQIMVFQVLFNVLTAAVLFALFFVEQSTNAPLVRWAVTHLSDDVASQMALVYLIFNVFGALMMFALRGPILRWIEGRWPPLPEEDMAKLKFLNDQVLDDPELALELAEEELRRFFGLLSGHLEALRLPTGEDLAHGETTGNTLLALHDAIRQALSELKDRSMDHEGAEHLISLVNRHRMLGTLQSSLSDFARAVRAAKESPNLARLAATVIESLDALLMVADDAVAGEEPEDINDLLEATHDRAPQMRAIRARFMRGSETLADEERLDLMGLTNGLERTVWVLHEFGTELARQQDAEPG
ncbi:MAG: Na/Pi cotransporter family protein [Myxococcales bacterium]|nr:Na/Pi cotransporter family protein [Myxococcales bacterium]